MANQSEKKNKLKNQQSNRIILIFIGVITGIYLLFQSYFYLLKKYPVPRSQIISFILSNIVNYLLFYLIDFWRNSMWEKYLIDILGLNLLIELLSIKSWKFWLLYPGIGFLIGSKYLIAYVGTIGKQDPNEMEMDPKMDPKNKKKGMEKQKVKYVKVH